MYYKERPDGTHKIQEALNAKLKVKKGLVDELGEEKQSELAQARAYYSSDPKPKTAFEFAQYKADDVKENLHKLFNKKCAYCESFYDTTGPVDVEHYRPKGTVTEYSEHNAGEKHPGYWWLAATWGNLLPSCIDCNRKRKHKVYKPGMTPDELDDLEKLNDRETSGKANAFPTSNNTWITNEHHNITDEDPLLINPCITDPAKHMKWYFSYDTNARIWQDELAMAILLPVTLEGGKNDPCGEASIRIYGLNRPGLMRARMTVIRNMQMLCLPIEKEFVRSVQATTLEQQEKHVALVRQYKANLNSFAQKGKAYSAMAAAFITRFEEDLAGLGAELEGAVPTAAG
jgi:hypothetical protein